MQWANFNTSMAQAFLASSCSVSIPPMKIIPKLYHSTWCSINSPQNYDAKRCSIPRHAFSSSSLQHIIFHDHLISSTERAWGLKDELLSEIGEDPLECLNWIDAAQRLGIDYHFQSEIDEILERISITDPVEPKTDLHHIALRFRLLRQHGYFVPAEVLRSFMDEEGHFKKELKRDIQGLMSLNEASWLCLPGEAILEEAARFSEHILKACLKNMDSIQESHVTRTLTCPFHTSLSKFMVKTYFGIGDFQATNKWTNALLKAAKVEFNIVQSIHQQEMFQSFQWWKEIGLAEELQFARVQPLKWYICSLACLSDPCFSEERLNLMKPISFVYLIDDIFDLYGSLDELSLFAEAVERWDLAIAEELPDCMKMCFKSLYETTNEISCKVHQKHGWNPIDSLRKSWEKLCNAFMVEAEWFRSGHLPSAEDYLRNGVFSTGVDVVLVHVFFLIGQGINKETVQLLESNPEIVSCSATILRLQDDLESAEDENQDGYDGSYVKYYMAENEHVSLESTRKHVSDLISFAWKKLNRECLRPNPFPAAFIETALNIARAVPLLYGYDGNRSLPTLEKLVNSVLYEGVQI